MAEDWVAFDDPFVAGDIGNGSELAYRDVSLCRWSFCSGVVGNAHLVIS